MVPWATLEPGLVEKMVAVFLSWENPNAQRIQPAKGDGGLDVIVPCGDSWVDYQVKYFSKRLDRSSRSQIKKSLKKAIATHKDPGNTFNLSAWYATIPIDPTRAEIEWLEVVAREVEAPFPCEFRGLPFLERMAADSPSVVDYYIGDGRDRLDLTLSRLADMLGLQKAEESGAVLTPTDAAGHLQAIGELLNGDDPHFYYEFSGTQTVPEGNSRPGLVASVSLGGADGYVTFDIFARYVEATEDRPIPLTVRLDPVKISDVDKAAWQSALKFGTPATLAGDGIELDLDLPAGLGHSGPMSQLQISQSADSGVSESRSRWSILGPLTDDVRADLVVCITEKTQGSGGLRVAGTDENGLLGIEFLAERTAFGNYGSTLNLTLAGYEQWQGRLVGEVTPVLVFLSHWGKPNRLLFGHVRGVPQRSAEFPMDAPFDVPEWAVNYFQALATIATAAGTDIRVPDQQDLNAEDINLALGLAHVINGYGPVLGQISQAKIDLPPDVATEFAEQPGLPRELLVPFIVTVGDQTVLTPPLSVTFQRTRFKLEGKPRTKGEHAIQTLRISPLGEQPPQALISLPA